MDLSLYFLLMSLIVANTDQKDHFVQLPLL